MSVRVLLLSAVVLCLAAGNAAAQATATTQKCEIVSLRAVANGIKNKFKADLLADGYEYARVSARLKVKEGQFVTEPVTSRFSAYELVTADPPSCTTPPCARTASITGSIAQFQQCHRNYDLTVRYRARAKEPSPNDPAGTPTVDINGQLTQQVTLYGTLNP